MYVAVSLKGGDHAECGHFKQSDFRGFASWLRGSFVSNAVDGRHIQRFFICGGFGIDFFFSCRERPV